MTCLPITGSCRWGSSCRAPTSRWPSRGPGARCWSVPRRTCAEGRSLASPSWGSRTTIRTPRAFNAAIQINTPLTYDSEGNLYFGYYSTGAPLPGYPDGIPGGLARITRKGDRVIHHGGRALRR